MCVGWVIGGVSYAQSSPLCLSASTPRSCGQGSRGEGDLEIPGFWIKSGFRGGGGEQLPMEAGLLELTTVSQECCLGHGR